MIFSGTASSVNTMRQSQNALSLLTKLFFFLRWPLLRVEGLTLTQS